MGCSIKLLGRCERTGKDGTLSAIVAPFLVPAGNPLSSVEDVFNAILVHGNMIGDVMFYGRGAGKEATASAVVSDVTEIIRERGKHIPVELVEGPVRIEGGAGSCREVTLRSGSTYRILD